MDWGIFPDIKEITCQESCGHMGCNYWRTLDPICSLCTIKIKTGDKVYIEDGKYVHAKCVWKRQAKEWDAMSVKNKD